MATSIVYFVGSIGLERFLGMLIALLPRSLGRATNVIISLLLTPMFIALVIVGRLRRFMLAPSQGLLAWPLTLCGINVAGILCSFGPAIGRSNPDGRLGMEAAVMLIVLRSLASPTL